ncbi:hypothetical protein MSIMFI_05299 [Mycobacterium simulans]|uniref:RNA-guided endonuclease TnpB family protein n=1 Tax=Mycobacterium simulans TaxID=627089 RepID=UPI00174A4835|nr:RNA-guided endonuclease TnpB family protein [Mycobacterium simulans]SON63768.1 hypothetical protein MSIMFI_05299 [Mycobacterium simulans]
MARFEIPQGWTAQAYRFALDPTPTQLRALASHAGAARFAHNHMLALVKAVMDQRAAERSYGISESALTPVLGWSLPALRKVWNQRKTGYAPWWAENSKEAYNTGLDGLARGLDAWSSSRHGQRAGGVVGFPRFRSARTPKAVRFTTGTIRIEADRRHVTLPRLGAIRTHESTRKLARRIEAGSARILQRRAARQHGRYDWQIRTRQQPKKRWRATQARIGRVHAHAAAVRRDVLHKATTRLAQQHDVVVVETLNAGGMRSAGGARKRGLNRALADAAVAEIRRMLGYKSRWYGCHLVEADRFFPSSKTCTACGRRKPNLTLADRVFACDGCGVRIDGDLGAAINLARLGVPTQLGEQSPAGSGPVAGRGATHETEPAPAGDAAGEEASTPHHHQADQTGTASPQGEAA